MASETAEQSAESPIPISRGVRSPYAPEEGVRRSDTVTLQRFIW